MKDQFVPYELALQLKELGYNERDFGFYRHSLEEEKEPFIKTELIFFRERYDNHNFRLELHLQGRIGGICTAPLWQQAFDWFSDHKKLSGHLIELHGEIYWRIVMKGDKTGTSRGHMKTESSRYEARVACLTKLIELCK